MEKKLERSDTSLPMARSQRPKAIFLANGQKPTANGHLLSRHRDVHDVGGGGAAEDLAGQVVGEFEEVAPHFAQ